MSLKDLLSKIPLVRPLVIRVLGLFPRDVTITNQWSGYHMKVNSYRHKGYWYHNRGREQATMEFFSRLRLIQEGDTVVEAGGHIGYVTQYFAKLVGRDGLVVVFEPGLNNAPYIEYNTSSLPNVSVERIAVSSENGKASFFEDNVTGQNNSLLGDYEGAELAAGWHYQDLGAHGA